MLLPLQFLQVSHTKIVQVHWQLTFDEGTESFRLGANYDAICKLTHAGEYVAQNPLLTDRWPCNVRNK